jgi:mannose/fructose/N-acetylgalactosamine-specific phosphotransferase system component IID
VQDIINDILPCMLPLVSFGIVYWLLGRKVKPLSIIGGWRWWAFWVRGLACFNGSRKWYQQ